MSTDAYNPTLLDFSGVVSQVQRWVEHGFYPGAGLVIGEHQQTIFEHYFGAHDAESEKRPSSTARA